MNNPKPPSERIEGKITGRKKATKREEIRKLKERMNNPPSKHLTAHLCFRGLRFDEVLKLTEGK